MVYTKHQTSGKLLLSFDVHQILSTSILMFPALELGKQHRLPYSTDGKIRAQRVGEVIHSDVPGPMKTPSLGGSVYFVTFIDDYSGYCVIDLKKKKYESLVISRHFVLVSRISSADRCQHFVQTTVVNTSAMISESG